VTRDERERLAGNLAAIIDDVYAVTRTRERRLALVTRYVDCAFYLGWRNRGGSIDEITRYST
jgi:hypothetical protein